MLQTFIALKNRQEFSAPMFSVKNSKISKLPLLQELLKSLSFVMPFTRVGKCKPTVLTLSINCM